MAAEAPAVETVDAVVRLDELPDAEDPTQMRPSIVIRTSTGVEYETWGAVMFLRAPEQREMYMLCAATPVDGDYSDAAHVNIKCRLRCASAVDVMALHSALARHIGAATPVRPFAKIESLQIAPS